MKARPAKANLFTLNEKNAKKLTLILGCVLLILIIIIALFPLLDREQERAEVTTYSMGSYVLQTVYGDDRDKAAESAASAVQELENKISWRISNSDIYKLNAAAGENWTKISDETFSILSMAQGVSEKSGGAFDITIAPISRLWDFDNDRREIPDADLIASMLENVGYEELRLDADDGTASLKSYGTAIDLGAVGKGAACDAAVEVYKGSDVSAAIVSVGGSVGIYGEKETGKPWSVAVRDPKSSGTLGTLSVVSGFISTSGSYEKYFEADGKLYHHIIDPSTGYPAESGLVSVTVLSDSGALSDALATACFVLGLDDGLALLEEYDAQGIFIDNNDRVTVTAGLSDSFKLSADGYSLSFTES